MQVRDFRLAGDIGAAGEQVFRELQLLAVLRFQLVELQDNTDFVLFDGRQAFAVGVVTRRDIFQQRLLFHRQGGELRLQAGQRRRHRIQAHADAGGGGVE